MPAFQSLQIDKIKSPLAITTTYYAGYIGLGLVAAALGPSLPGLAAQTGVQLKQISLLFTAVNLGYMVGALTGGRAYDRRPGHPMMAVGLICAAAALALAPLIPHLALLAAVMFAFGGLQSFVDVGGNTLLVWLHREKIGPFMNALHLCWGVGTMIAPIIIGQAIAHSGSFAWGYWLIALLLTPPAVFLMLLPSPEAPKAALGAAPLKANTWTLMILFMLFFTAFVGAEGAYGGWIYSYAVTTGIAVPAGAAIMTSVYWGSLTLGRLVSIPLAMRFKPRSLLIADLAGCLVGLSLAVFGGGSPTVIWLATIIIGASSASLFPVSLAFASESLTVTGQFTGLMFVGASLGGMTLPWLIGQFFESIGPQSAMWLMLGDIVICTAIFVVLNRVKNALHQRERL